MKTFKLSKFTRGWFIGDFSPSVVKTKEFEVGVKEYRAGEKEQAHYHKRADEITVIVQGRCKMNEKVFKVGDIVWVRPGEVIEFEALDETTNIVIKIPSVKGDKYIAY